MPASPTEAATTAAVDKAVMVVVNVWDGDTATQSVSCLADEDHRSVNLVIE